MSHKHNPRCQLWGIYRSHKANSRQPVGSLITFIASPTSQEAERVARRLGFHRPVAKAITSDQAIKARWLPIAREFRHPQTPHKPTRGFRV